MDKRAEIAAKLAALAKSSSEVFFTGRVVSVEGKTCTIDYDGLHVSDVRLTPTTSDRKDVIMITPAVDSYVLVASRSGDLVNLEVIKADTAQSLELLFGDIGVFIDENGVVFNDGKLGGMVVGSKMVQWMQKVHADLLTLQAQLATAPVVGNGAPLALTFNPSTPAPVVGDFENKKMTQ